MIGSDFNRASYGLGLATIFGSVAAISISLWELAKFLFQHLHVLLRWS